MYLDPPYGNNYGSYAVDSSEEEAACIVETITGEKSKAQIAVSGYPDCYFSELEKHGWERHEKQTYTKVAAVTGGRQVNVDPRVECLWVNYEPPAVQPNLL